MKKYISLLITAIFLTTPLLLSAQGAICAEMEPFCSDTGASFPASTNTQAEPDNQYGCLGTQPNPAWYYLEIDNPGSLEITITNSNNVDIDFIVYGPYADLQTAQARCGSFQTQEFTCPASGNCPNGVPCSIFDGCLDGDGVDCSYNPQSTEIADISNTQTGEVYVFLITNFSGLPTEIFLNKTAGEATTDCSIVEECTNSGGQVVGPTSVELCAEDPPYILETMNEVTNPAAGLPDIIWAVWVLDDPLNVATVPGGSLPDDSFMADDPNFIGVLSNGPGQIIFGTSIQLIADGSGVTYYIAPLVGLGSFGTFDSECTGLDPAQGYTVYMNPPLSANVGVNSCDIQVDLTGGFPSVENTANYEWSYTTPNGQTVTGMGTPISVVGALNGNYTFSITNDGNDCDLLSFATVTIVGCDCTENVPTTTVSCDDGNSCTINDVEIILDSNGSICEPCAGTPIDCDSGQTTTQACDDGDPCTINDEAIVLACDGSICVPCAGTPVDCDSGQTTTQACNDDDPCTINDEAIVLACDGSICEPCAGTPVDCDSGQTTTQACDDGDPCTINDEEVILACDGSICVPCTGTLINCGSGQTTTQACDDGNPCTINDEEVVLSCDGFICVPCVGTLVNCDSGQTTTQACDDGNPNTENDMETVLSCDSSICVPCEGTPVMNQCIITSAGVEIFCDDKGTETYDDDTFSFTLNPTGDNLGITYTVSGMVNATSLSYGAPSVSLGPFDSGTLINITITDDSDANCQLNEQVFSDCFNEIVPTLSEWSLIILALLLLNLGVLYIRQNEMKLIRETT